MSYYQPPPGPPAPYTYQAPAPVPPRNTTPTLIVAIVAAVALVAVLGTVVVMRSGDKTPTVSQPAGVVVTPVPAAPTAAPVVAAPAPAAAPAPVAAQAPPSGLYCRDLKARGYSYPEAVGYWEREGRPLRMDADQNGIPCETLYSAGEVKAYWGYIATPTGSGLLCKDLRDRGYDYTDAVSYWIEENYPSRMDADGNGIPCETVYPAWEVNDYWAEVQNQQGP